MPHQGGKDFVSAQGKEGTVGDDQGVKMAYFLAGDLGGTKTLLALCETGPDGHLVLAEQRLQSHGYPDLGAMLEEFLASAPFIPEVAVFAVAGPVLGDQARLTNLGWTIDRHLLKERFRFRAVALMNDLVAVAHAVPVLAADRLFTINTGRSDPQGGIAVLAPGTGLGEAFLCWDGSRYRPYPSEGGHVDFASTSDEEDGLLHFLRARLAHVSYEQVCSGLGIANIFSYLAEGKGMAVAADLAGAHAAADKTPLIVAHALAGDCPVCGRTMEIFLDVLAAEAGNLAVKFLATGGVYLGGGILPRILDAIDPVAFMEKFVGKGRMADLLADVPVHIIMNGDCALLGAAGAGARLARKG